MESVPFKTIAIFTILQIVYFLICYGVQLIPIGGILFPLPFFLLISIREHLLPRIFNPIDLQELDAAEYEEILGVPNSVHNVLNNLILCLCTIILNANFLTNISKMFDQDKDPDDDDDDDDDDNAEILDEMTTHRGELKLRTVSRRNSRSFAEDRQQTDIY